MLNAQPENMSFIQQDFPVKTVYSISRTSQEKDENVLRSMAAVFLSNILKIRLWEDAAQFLSIQ